MLVHTPRANCRPTSPAADGWLCLSCLRDRHGFDRKTCDRLVSSLFESLHLIEETPPLMRRLKASGYGIYAITDNVHEIVAYLRGRYDFWPLFDGACVSADHSTLKPDPRMYTWLTETYDLVPGECVFFDDLQKNVDGAKAGEANKRCAPGGSARCAIS